MPRACAGAVRIGRGPGKCHHEVGGGPCYARTPGQPAGAGGGRAGGAAVGAEELDDIALRCKLKALSTHETYLDRREANHEWEQKALEDSRAQILPHELDADAQETRLRDQEARLRDPGAAYAR
jgi:hypothetical protein